MAQGHEEAVTRHCPRCGGLMKKPAGSSLFWHAETNHPRCDITSIVDTAPLIVQSHDSTNDVPPAAEPPRGKQQKKK